MSGEDTRSVTVGDIDIAYVRHGSGPPVVLVHGLAEDHESWRPVLDRLADRDLHAVDLRGHGRTTLGQADGSVSQLAADLIGFLEAVTGPASVVGYSLGGSVALLARADRPDLFRGLAVIGTSSVVGSAAADFFATRIEQIESGRLDDFAAGLRDDTSRQILTEADVDGRAEARLAAVGRGEGYVNAARAMIAMRHDPIHPRLADIADHVDVIAADGDGFCPPKAGRMIVDALSAATYHEIRGAGHLITVDRPDELVALLDRLLERAAP